MVVGTMAQYTLSWRRDIWLYGMSGKLLGKVPRYEEDIDDMYLPLDSGLLAASTGFRMISCASTGREAGVDHPEAISGVTE
jgi:hypothetical protein